MFNFRTFPRSLDPGEGGYRAFTSRDTALLTDEGLFFESDLSTGPFRFETLNLTYEGDFDVVGLEVFGEITKVTLSIGRQTHFEIIPDEPIDVDDYDDFLNDVDDDDEDANDNPEGANIDDYGYLEAVNNVLHALWDNGFSFRGSRKSDDFEGGKGDDRMNGGRGDDDLKGGVGNDELDGGAGVDALMGGRGADRLEGGHGRDMLDGGRGADVFVFVDLSDLGRGGKSDVVVRFEGKDVIDLSEIDAKAGRKGDQAFRFSEDDFSGRSGELRFDGDALEGDLDGDGRADFEIRISRGSLDADDLLL